jgi:mRNA interferase RelE/StbE
MEVRFSKAFEKQTTDIKDKALFERLCKVIKTVANCKTISNIPNLKPITGYSGYYRIRLGDYRIGISVEGKTVWFHFFGKRDESTYKKFP